MSEEANVWTIEELVELTDEVQTGSVNYRGKDFNFQYCELTEKEEPNLKALPKTATDQEQQDWATETGTERILAMIEKANTKNPEGVTITSDNWSDIPLTLRYLVTSEIIAYQQEATEKFTTG